MTKLEITNIWKENISYNRYDLDIDGEFMCLDDIVLIHYKKYNDMAYGVFKINEDIMIETTFEFESFLSTIKVLTFKCKIFS